MKVSQLTDPGHFLIDNFDASIHVGTISNDDTIKKNNLVSIYSMLCEKNYIYIYLIKQTCDIVALPPKEREPVSPIVVWWGHNWVPVYRCSYTEAAR